MNHARFSSITRGFIVLAAIYAGFPAVADEVIPPAPKHFFNDYAHVTSDEVAKRLDAQLAQFEKDTTAQFVVAVFPKMQSDASLDDYSLRIANAWKIGQKDKNNGLLLLVFMQDHKMRVEAGRSLEKIATDAICLKIIEEEIAPRFRKKDFDGGLIAGVHALMTAATNGKHDAGKADATPPAAATPAAAK